MKRGKVSLQKSCIQAVFEGSHGDVPVIDSMAEFEEAAIASKLSKIMNVPETSIKIFG
jgi:hypothetical protein